MFPVESLRFVLMLVMKRVERPVPVISDHVALAPAPAFNVRQTLPLVVAARTMLLSLRSTSIVLTFPGPEVWQSPDLLALRSAEMAVHVSPRSIVCQMRQVPK